LSGPPYMPFYVGDYLADTRHLTTTEHGAYLLLLMALWRSGGTMSADDKFLCRCAGISNTQWQKMKPTLLAFFDIDSGEITHGRLSTEWTKYEAAVRQRRIAGSNGGKANALKYNKVAVADAQRSLKQPKPEPYININGVRFAEESLREEAVAVMGEPWVRSYLDPSKWVAEDLMIEARSRLACDTLARALRASLKAKKIGVRCMGSGPPEKPVTDAL